jgi:hypothetical protein
MTTEIFVRLLDEGVDVWRPVRAEPVHGNIFRIANQPYDGTTENWQFQPGDEVVAEPTDSSNGEILAAIRLAET